MIRTNHRARRRSMPGVLTPKRIPDPAEVQDQSRSAVGLELLSQMGDVDVEGVGLGRLIVTPQPLHQLLAGQHLGRVAHEEEQKGELSPGELNSARASMNLAGSW